MLVENGEKMITMICFRKFVNLSLLDIVNKYKKVSNIKDFIPVVKIDKEISLREMTIQNIKELSLLEPYGESNKLPIFIYKNLKIDSIRALSDGKHLKLTLKDGNSIINAIGFNIGYLAEEYMEKKKLCTDEEKEVWLLGIPPVPTSLSASNFFVTIK